MSVFKIRLNQALEKAAQKVTSHGICCEARAADLLKKHSYHGCLLILFAEEYEALGVWGCGLYIWVRVMLR